MDQKSIELMDHVDRRKFFQVYECGSVINRITFHRVLQSNLLSFWSSNVLQTEFPVYQMIINVSYIINNLYTSLLSRVRIFIVLLVHLWYALVYSHCEVVFVQSCWISVIARWKIADVAWLMQKSINCTCSCLNFDIGKHMTVTTYTYIWRTLVNVTFLCWSVY